MPVGGKHRRPLGQTKTCRYTSHLDPALLRLRRILTLLFAESSTKEYTRGRLFKEPARLQRRIRNQEGEGHDVEHDAEFDDFERWIGFGRRNCRMPGPRG